MFLRFLRGVFYFIVLLAFNAFFAVLIFIAVLYDKLPPLDNIADYRPRLPMRIYSVEGDLLGEFGEERRTITRYRDFPPTLVDTLLATEDARFFHHYGLDITGVMRATFGYLQGRREGASTITMQVARNFYLQRSRTILRKIVEIMLALRIEQQFTKKQILERYMNQIYLGHGSYGFTAAAREYYNKSLDELTVAEIAVLAGLPKSPSGANPRSHPARAKTRQQHVLRRMYDNKIIDESVHEELANADLPPLANSARQLPGHADYIAEEVRRIVYDHFGDSAYERGFRIHTTIQSRLQKAATDAVRQGLLAHEGRRAYPGAEEYIDNRGFRRADYLAALRKIATIGDLQPAIVTKATKKQLTVIGKDGKEYEIAGDGLARVKKHLPGGKEPILREGAVVRLTAGDDDNRQIVSVPAAQAAFVALSSEDGAVLAMAGGFDFANNQFNNATQAKRQPGSVLKPFVYSAALEKGLMPASILPDTPIFLSAAETGSNQSWQPKNYDGKTAGPITMREALSKSKNLASIHLLKHIGAPYGRDYLLRFGFLAGDHPPYLTLVLGVGGATPLEMASAYAVFSNGGYLVHPYFISRVEDYDGNKIINELDFKNRRVAIARRNAFIMVSLLQSVVKEGTGRGVAVLKRDDIGGKTGTTNDTRDAWFAGFGGNLTGVSWIGYAQPKSLGKRETGGRAALPIWRDFMSVALDKKPEIEYLLPDGIIAADVDKTSGKILPPDTAENARHEYFYAEYLPAAESSPSGGEAEQLF